MLVNRTSALVLLDKAGLVLSKGRHNIHLVVAALAVVASHIQGPYQACVAVDEVVLAVLAAVDFVVGWVSQIGDSVPKQVAMNSDRMASRASMNLDPVTSHRSIDE